MSKMLTLRVPEEAWATISETIGLDCQSSAFDPKLREEISAAWDQVEQVEVLDVTPKMKELTDGR